MNDNPFRDQPDLGNPYAPPTVHASPNGSANPLMVPAIFLLVLSSLMLVVVIASLPGQIVRIRAADFSTPAGQGELAGGVSSLAFWLLTNLAIVIGSFDMLRLKNYRIRGGDRRHAPHLLALFCSGNPVWDLGDGVAAESTGQVALPLGERQDVAGV